MTSNKPKFSRECSSHSEEPIIRASLDLKTPKLLYCHECLEGMNKNTQSSLIKFGHIGDKLYEQLTERYEHFNKSNVDIDFTKFSINKEEYETKIEGLISKQRDQVEEEFKKVQAEVLEVLKVSRTQTLGTLDKIKTNLLEAHGSYMEQVNSLADLSKYKDKGITKEEIETEIANDNEDIAAIEKRIRARLETIKRFDEIKEGTITATLESRKIKLEKNIEVLKLAPAKDTEDYKGALKELTTFFQAIVFENKDKKDENEPSSYLPGQAESLEKLAQAVQTSQTALRKIKDHVSNYLTNITNIYPADSDSIKPNSSPVRNAITSRNMRANEQYDEGFDVESDEEIEVMSEESQSRSRSRSTPHSSPRVRARSSSEPRTRRVTRESAPARVARRIQRVESSDQSSEDIEEIGLEEEIDENY